MKRPNILYLFETAVGLGHQRRASGIVNGMADAGYDVSVASGSFVDADHYFRPEVRRVALPANRRRKNGEFAFYDTDNNLVFDPDHDSKVWQQNRAKAIEPFASERKIDAVLAEWWPFNRRKEFDRIIETIETVQQQKFGQKPMIVSSVRDILKFGAAHEHGPEEKTVAEAINAKVDAVLMHSDPALITFEEVFRAKHLLHKPVLHTGYVVNEGAKRQGPEARDGRVIVSCGSGDEGHHMLKATLSALPYAQSMKHLEWHFVQGPRMEKPHRDDFRMAADGMSRRINGTRVVFHDDMADLPETLSKAGFSISLAGYNTTMEVMASGIPAVLVPKFICDGKRKISRIEAEQWKRLVRLQERGMAAIADPATALKPMSFARILEDSYRNGPRQIALDTDGARATANLMGRMIADRSDALRAGTYAAVAPSNIIAYENNDRPASIPGQGPQPRIAAIA